MKIKRFVRQSLFLLFFCLPFGHSALAQKLPPIEAHRFESKPVQVSTSGRVYRFAMRSSDVPRVGNIVLIKEQNKPAMAFRVIKSDPDKKEYIAKRVRRYDQNQKLSINRYYLSLEKIADRITAPKTEEPFDTSEPAQTIVDDSSVVDSPPETIPAQPTPKPEPTPEPTPVPHIINPTPRPQDTGVSEINPDAAQSTPDQNLEVYDSGLDAGTTPQKTEETASIDYEEDEDDFAGSFEVEETKRFDPFKNLISVQTGFYRNASDFIMGGEIFPGFSVGYSKKMRDDFLITRRAQPQDSLWFETGFSYYRKADNNNDVYTLFPVRAELRWEINLSPGLAIAAFGGVQYNFLIGSDNAEAGNLERLEGIQPTLGVGLLFNIGPQWYLRSDFGYDRVNLGLGVKW